LVKGDGLAEVEELSVGEMALAIGDMGRGPGEVALGGALLGVKGDKGGLGGA
jgi:hypothetical protein